MDIALVDVSDIKIPGQKRYDIKDTPGEICVTRKIPLENITEDIISCEEISWKGLGLVS